MRVREAPSKLTLPNETTGLVHCPICTHQVEARVLVGKKRPWVKPGQRCPRCGSSLDAGWVLSYDSFDRAA